MERAACRPLAQRLGHSPTDPGKHLRSGNLRRRRLPDL